MNPTYLPFFIFAFSLRLPAQWNYMEFSHVLCVGLIDFRQNCTIHHIFLHRFRVASTIDEKKIRRKKKQQNRFIYLIKSFWVGLSVFLLSFFFFFQCFDGECNTFLFVNIFVFFISLTLCSWFFFVVSLAERKKSVVKKFSNKQMFNFKCFSRLYLFICAHL